MHPPTNCFHIACLRQSGSECKRAKSLVKCTHTTSQTKTDNSTASKAVLTHTLNKPTLFRQTDLLLAHACEIFIAAFLRESADVQIGTAELATSSLHTSSLHTSTSKVGLDIS